MNISETCLDDSFLGSLMKAHDSWIQYFLIEPSSGKLICLGINVL